MEKITFNSVDELYNRLKPAFQLKVNEFKSKNMNFISSKEIWSFLSKTKWSKEKDLELCEKSVKTPICETKGGYIEKLINFINMTK